MDPLDPAFMPLARLAFPAAFPAALPAAVGKASGDEITTSCGGGVAVPRFSPNRLPPTDDSELRTELILEIEDKIQEKK